jgi:dihydroorotase
MMRWLVKGARVICPTQQIDAQMDLLVQDGKINALGYNLPADDAQLINAEGLLLAPGFVDLHAHLGDPSREDRETMESGAATAAKGGFTTIVMMPDTEPPLDNAPAVAQAVARGNQTTVRVLVAAALTKGLAGNDMTEFHTLKAAGAAFFCQPDSTVRNSGLLRRTLQYGQGIGPFIAEQPHDSNLIDDGMMHEGANATYFGIKGMPALAEEVIVARDLLLAAETCSPIHLSLISSAASVQMIAEAKARGVPVTCDVSAQHLVYTDAALESYDPNYKLLPPLRTEEDRQALRLGVLNGTIDCIVTNHTPLTPEEKDVEFTLAPYGALGLETAFALLFTHWVQNESKYLAQVIAALSAHPARLLRQPAVTGHLVPGSPADFVLIDEKLSRTVRSADLASVSKNCSELNATLHGWPVATFVAGKPVYAVGDLAWVMS